MNIGIIVYSQSGHTLSVATELQEALSTAGYSVDLNRVIAVGKPRSGDTDVPLETIPEINAYDALVFGCPVWGGTPASPMGGYLEQVISLQGKAVAVLVTGAFPAGVGRNLAVAQLKATCESKGATVCGMASVGWWSLRRKKRVAEAVGELVTSFSDCER